MMRNYNITAGIPAFAIEYFRSEDSEKGSTASDGADQAAMYDDFQYNTNNGLIKAYWSQNYAIIYQCNDVIETIEKGNLTEENDLRNKGEALSSVLTVTSIWSVHSAKCRWSLSK